MFKTILRFLVITFIAVALGLLIYHLNQPSGSASFGSGIRNFGNFSRDFGGEGGFHEGGVSLSRGLFGITGKSAADCDRHRHCCYDAEDICS